MFLVFRRRYSLNAFPSASPLGDACFCLLLLEPEFRIQHIHIDEIIQKGGNCQQYGTAGQLQRSYYLRHTRISVGLFKMVSAKLSVSVASLSDLLARYVAIARKISEFAPIWTSEFYGDYRRVKCQLQKLQRICQKYPPLRYVYHSSSTSSSLAEKH